MTCNHVMLDLETLSTRCDAAIIQIAAARFNPIAGTVCESGAFNVYVKVSPGHIDLNTVAWWMQQGVAAQVGKAVQDHGVALGVALSRLRDWLCEPQGLPDPSLCVWAHGATFDLPILTYHYGLMSLDVPWHYRAPRDTRTLYDLTPGGMPELPSDDTRKHDALYDATLQAKQVCEAFRRVATWNNAGREYPLAPWLM